MTYYPPSGTPQLMGHGYSGVGRGLNNPDMQDASRVGPIPRGFYSIGPQRDHVEHLADGKTRTLRAAMALMPTPDNPTERTGFYIHGDNSSGNHSASQGCIVLPPQVRDRIHDLGVATLEVVHP